jgi:hypothetical protein
MERRFDLQVLRVYGPVPDSFIIRRVGTPAIIEKMQEVFNREMGE